MEVFKNLDSLDGLDDCVLTIGSFDGVHQGHKEIFKKLKALTYDNDAKSVVVTFHPHPRSIIYPKDKSLQLLTELDEKIRFIAAQGIDVLVVVPFTIEFSQLSAEEYVEKFLYGKFKPQKIVIGYDHKFGLNRRGNIDLLKSKSSTFGYEVIEITKQEIEDITISSTKIRDAIQKGYLEKANILLGQAYSVSGTVVRGRQLGTELGFPTANISIDSSFKLIPKNGIYVVKVEVQDKEYEGMLYIGNIPTITDGKSRTIEVNIFDFNDDIYNEYISVRLLKYLRGDVKFSSLEEMKAQLEVDRLQSLEYLNDNEKPHSLDTTIAILNYNTEDHLENYLPSVSFSSGHDFSTLVIDNGSSDNSVKYIQEWHPDVSIVQLNENHGFSKGYNLGIREISTKYTVLLNSDVLVEQGWLDPLIEFLDSHKEYAGVMPKILDLNRKEYFEYAGAAGGYIDYLAFPFCRGRMFETLEKDEGQYDTIEDIFWATGAALVVRTELFKNFGGLDSDYFAHQEEIDFCWRLNNAGYKFACIPKSVVYHLGGGTLSYDNPRKLFLNFRNSLANIFKNDLSGTFGFKIILRMLFDGIAAFKFLFGGKASGFIAVLKAHIAFYGWLPSLWRKRKINKQLISRFKIGKPNTKIKLNRSIVLSYYLFGKRFFSKLKFRD